MEDYLKHFPYYKLEYLINDTDFFCSQLANKQKKAQQSFKRYDVRQTFVNFPFSSVVSDEHLEMLWLLGCKCNVHTNITCFYSVP